MREPTLSLDIGPRSLRLREGLPLILKTGSGSEMANAFDAAGPYGRTGWNEFVCMVGCIVAMMRGYLRPYSEGWYILTEKGRKRAETL
jgi:hypothetical protein